MNATVISKERLRLAVFSFFFCQGLAFASWASRIPTIKTHLGLSDGMLGTLLLLLPAGQLLTMPVAASLVSRFGSKAVLRIMLVIYGLFLCCLAIAPNVYVLGGALAGFGIASNMCNIAVNTQAVAVEDRYGKSIMSAFHGAWSLAGFVGAMIGWFTISVALDTTCHFLIIWAIMLLNVLWNAKYLIAPKARAMASKPKTKFKPDVLLVQLGLIGFFSMATEGAMFDWSGVYFQDVVLARADLVVLGYASFMIMMATGRFIGDSLVRKIGRKNLLIWSGALMFGGMMLSVLLPNIWASTIGFMAVGLGVACCVPTVYSVSGKHPKFEPGMALAMVSSISFLGFLMGPPLIGFIAEATSLRWSYAVFSLFGLIMSVLVSRLKINYDN